MHLIFRPARLTDLPAFLPCTRDLFLFDESERKDLLRMWRDLLRNGATNIFVWEDIGNPQGNSIAFFAVYVFVTDEFAEALRTVPSGLGVLALDWWRKGCSPFLSLTDLRTANTVGEVSMVCLHSGVPEGWLGRPEGQEVFDRIVDWIYLAIGGYRLKEYWIEAYSELESDWSVAAGFSLCKHFPEQDAAGDALRWAWRYVATCEEAPTQQGTLVAPLFRYVPPRFSFTPVEQELLWWALTSEMTDEALAEELSIAVVTVRKRWDQIYDRVLAVAPELFPGQVPPQKRGGEKRRRLLHYLRSHVEELRPFLPPRKLRTR